MLENVPILMDEVTPGRSRGTRPPMSLHEVKRLCEVQESTATDARNNDISFRAGQARVFTTNALSPFGWNSKLPADVWLASPEERANLSPDIKAVFKWCAFALIEHNLIRQELRDAHTGRRRQARIVRYAGAFS
eukprot:TRINITY_DN7186_c0_g1_i1.p1 TRINITY_DN7186_c0_g1~~TRINITY_DN7186_c0_g1_i1.p1  ORF type:complete len:134 (+),score=6.55 TRINITY_DN7186_c0_g1_i1:280-681(+)